MSSEEEIGKFRQYEYQGITKLKKEKKKKKKKKDSEKMDSANASNYKKMQKGLSLDKKNDKFYES